MWKTVQTNCTDFNFSTRLTVAMTWMTGLEWCCHSAIQQQKQEELQRSGALTCDLEPYTMKREPNNTKLKANTMWFTTCSRAHEDKKSWWKIVDITQRSQTHKWKLTTQKLHSNLFQRSRTRPHYSPTNINLTVTTNIILICDRGRVMTELTHLSMLSQDTNEVKLIEAKQHNELILSFTIISRLLQMHKSTFFTYLSHLKHYRTSSSAVAERPHELDDFNGVGHFEAKF